MRFWLAVSLVVAAVGSAGGGCSSSTGPATVSAYCQQLATAECPSVFSVCASPPEATCESNVLSKCTAAATAAQLGGARLFTPENVGACVAAMGTAFGVSPGGTQFVTWNTLNGGSPTIAPGSGSPNDVCNQVFVGQQPPDANCRTSYDCASPNVCGANGVCGPLQTQSAGAGCSDPGDVCAEGTVCTAGPKFSTCTAGAQVGEACTANTPCATTAECEAGKCVALSGEGDPCTTSADCSQENKGAFGFCDTSLSKPICTAGYSFGTEAPDCAKFGGTGLDVGT